MAAGLAAGLAGCGGEKAEPRKVSAEKPAAAEVQPAKRPTVSVALWGGELQIRAVPRIFDAHLKILESQGFFLDSY